MKLPFAVIWPIIRMLAPLIIKLILPLILAKSKATGGSVVFSDSELSEFLDNNKQLIKHRYREA